MLDETFSEMSHCQWNFGKSKIEILAFLGEWDLISIFGPIGSKLGKSI